MDDRFLEARLDRSRYLAALDRHDEAVAELEPLLEQSPDNDWVALRYAEIVELESGDFRAAEQRLRTVLSRNPYFAEAWLLLGTVLRRAGRTGGGRGLPRSHCHTAPTCRSSDPSRPAPRRDRQIRRPRRLCAKRWLEPGGTRRPSCRSRRAPRGARTRREARQQFEIAASAPTFSAGTRNAKAMALLQLGRANEAEDVWRDLIRDQPDYWRAWLNMASLSIQRRDWAAVERYARTAVEREPTSADAWNNLAIGLEELGRTGEAESRLPAGERDRPERLSSPVQSRNPPSQKRPL